MVLNVKLLKITDTQTCLVKRKSVFMALVGLKLWIAGNLNDWMSNPWANQAKLKSWNKIHSGSLKMQYFLLSKISTSKSHANLLLLNTNQLLQITLFKQTNHNIKWDSAKVIDFESDNTNRWVKEAIWIHRKGKNILNKDEGHTNQTTSLINLSTPLTAASASSSYTKGRCWMGKVASLKKLLAVRSET